MLHRENEIRQYHTTSAADLIKETMVCHRVTQVDLAERLGVSPKSISDILKRKRFINETLAVRIEMVMGIASQLLLQLDANFRLNQAKQNAEKDVPKNQSNKFLKQYAWVGNEINSSYKK